MQAATTLLKYGIEIRGRPCEKTLISGNSGKTAIIIFHSGYNRYGDFEISKKNGLLFYLISRTPKNPGSSGEN